MQYYNFIILIVSLFTSSSLFPQNKISLLDSAFSQNSSIHLGKDSKSIQRTSLNVEKYNYLQKQFAPIKISYFTINTSESLRKFEIDSIFFNVDTLNKVSAIIFQVKNITLFEQILVNDYGTHSSKIHFNNGFSNVFVRGWTKKEYCVIILSPSSTISTLIIYNCDKNSFIDIPILNNN